MRYETKTHKYTQINTNKVVSVFTCNYNESRGKMCGGTCEGNILLTRPLTRIPCTSGRITRVKFNRRLRFFFWFSCGDCALNFDRKSEEISVHTLQTCGQADKKCVLGSLKYAPLHGKSTT